MAKKRESGKPIIDFPNEDDWNIPMTAEEDQVAYRGFIRAQESSMRQFWEETKDDKL